MSNESGCTSIHTNKRIHYIQYNAPSEYIISSNHLGHPISYNDLVEFIAGEMYRYYFSLTDEARSSNELVEGIYEMIGCDLNFDASFHSEVPGYSLVTGNNADDDILRNITLLNEANLLQVSSRKEFNELIIWKQVFGFENDEYVIKLDCQINSDSEGNQSESFELMELESMNIFEDTSGRYTYKIINGNEVEIILYEGNNLSVAIPDMIDGFPVVNIAAGAFYRFNSNQKKITKEYIKFIFKEIVLPSSLRYIGASAFNGNKSLNKIILPDSLLIIGSCSFKDCINLEEITFPLNLKEIASNAFENCARLVITSKIIGTRKDGVDLVSQQFPFYLKSIGDSAFENCKSIRHIEIPGQVKIGESAFYSCSNLESVIIREGVNKIDKYTFSNCEKLSSVVIPESIKHISDECFEWSNKDVLTIVGKKNCYAKSYADTNNFKYTYEKE